MNNIILSPLAHTWLLDLDGTIVKHNGYLLDGRDTLVAGAAEFLNSIPSSDRIIFLTSRKDEYRKSTLDFLQENQIRYDDILFELPYGERVIVNDKKPSGLPMSVAINTDRDEGNFPKIVIDKNL